MRDETPRLDEDFTPPRRVMMSVSEDHALREAELLTLRQIANALENTNRRLEGMQESLNDARERLVRIESTTVDATVADLSEKLGKALQRIDMLEADLDQRRGASKLVEALHKFGPWLLGMAAAVYTLMLGKVNL